MSTTLQAIRGMKDMLPTEAPYWQHLESIIRDTMRRYGLAEIRTPILEKTALFSRSVGEVTDIVEKEMYTFDDRNGDSLSLRPENTAAVIRAGIEAGLFYNQVQKLWYLGPQFRHERPQKGRLRQFHQCGVEVVGIADPAADAEVLLLTASLFQQLQLLPHVTLELNSLGTVADRALYRDALLTYFTRYENQLDEDCLRRLQTNPLRILDSKNPALAECIAGAPALADSLSTECRVHFDGLQQALTDGGIAFTVNPRLVRGLDYYSRTVFEWVTDALGSQNAVCSGGRYDGLIPLLGGEPTPAIGWALGEERIVLLMQELGIAPPGVVPDVFVVVVGDRASRAGLTVAERLRDSNPGLKVHAGLGGGGFKAQFKRADKSGATVAVIIGDDEADRGVAQVKHLRLENAQETCAIADVPARVAALLGAQGGR
jgi:histidyl-tRNA synthetase